MYGNFQTKEQMISSYLSEVNWDGDWSYKKIKHDLKNLIGEEPAISISYVKDAVMNEFNTEAKEINRVDSINVIFSPDLDRQVKTLSFKIGA